MSRRPRFDADDLEYEAAAKAMDKTQRPTCQTGKTYHRSFSKAANVAKLMRERRRDPFVEPYQCDQCGLWHVGHPPGTQRNRADLERFTKEPPCTDAGRPTTK